MRNSSPARKNQHRWTITSHTLKLQNFRLGGKYLIFDLIATGKNSAIYYGVQEKTKLERVFKFYNLKEIEEAKGFKEKQIVKRLSTYKYCLSNNCKSVNILKCLDIYQDRNYKIMVYQYCQKSLRDEINAREDKKISEIRAILILKQVLSALKSLHLNAQLLHTNLQVDKILVRNGIYKLIDFGLPSLSDEELQNPNEFLVPEIMNKRGFNQKAQVWSIGLLFHQILYGELPEALREQNRHKLRQPMDQSIFMDSYESRMTTQNVRNFLTSCLFINPQSRMNLQELENHPMFSILQGEKQIYEPEFRHQLSVVSIPARQHKGSSLSVVLPINQEAELVNYIERQRLQKLYTQHFHIGMVRKEIQKELEKNYQRFGQSFEIQQLQIASIAYLRAQVNKDQDQAYKKMKSYYLQCLKVEFIFYEIVQPLLKYKDITKERNELQVLYLILSTSFSAISRLHFEQKNQKQIKSQYQSLITSCVYKSSEQLYRAVEQSEKVYSRLLTQYESLASSIFKDGFSRIFYAGQFTSKDVFLRGIQKMDYTKQEKILFTKKFFKENKQIFQSRRQLSHEFDQQVKRAFFYMEIYVEIWEITDQKQIEQRYASLKSYIDAKFMPYINFNVSGTLSSILL